MSISVKLKKQPLKKTSCKRQHEKEQIMKSNTMIGMVSGLCLMTYLAGAQNFSENNIALASTNEQAIVSRTLDKSANTLTNKEVVDYPTVSYPETKAFSIEKEKAFYHLSWQVLMPENLSYTEIQSSSDGKTFATVGVLTNGGLDYFVPSDKGAKTSYFRLVQYSLNEQKHISAVLSIK